MSKTGIEELEAFYFKNSRIFWPELFTDLSKPTEDHIEWDTLVGNLISKLKKESFIVNLENK